MRLIVALFLLLVSVQAQAIVIDSTTDARLDFDFSDAFLQAPYTNLIMYLQFDEAIDDYGPNDAFTMRVFDATGIAVSESSTIGPFSTPSGGGLEVTFGGPAAFFTGTLNTDLAYVELTEIEGSFDLVSVIGRFYSPSDNQIEQFTGRISTVLVPEPTSLALMGLGLVGLGFVRGKKAA